MLRAFFYFKHSTADAVLECVMRNGASVAQQLDDHTVVADFDRTPKQFDCDLQVIGNAMPHVEQYIRRAQR